MAPVRGCTEKAGRAAGLKYVPLHGFAKRAGG